MSTESEPVIIQELFYTDNSYTEARDTCYTVKVVDSALKLYKPDQKAYKCLYMLVDIFHTGKLIAENICLPGSSVILAPEDDLQLTVKRFIAEKNLLAECAEILKLFTLNNIKVNKGETDEPLAAR